MEENKEENFTPIEPPQETEQQTTAEHNGDLLTEHYDNSVKMIQDE